MTQIGQPSPEQPPNLLSQLTLKQTSANEFQALHPPRKMGNPLNIAYGGYALAAAAKAACLSVPEGYHLYSLQGNFLGPAYTDRILCVSVRSVRQTRVFGTRVVEVWQPSPTRTKNKEGEGEGEGEEEEDTGRKRPCLLATADFMLPEPNSLLSYSATPLHAYPTWSACPTQDTAFDNLVHSGKVEKQLLDAHSKGFALLKQHFEQRLPPSSIFAHNLYGLAKALPHPQDSVPSAERTTADWIKSIEPISSTADNLAALAFLMDAAIAFLPLSFNHAWFDDVAAVSSLDFSLRLFTADVRVDRWLLRELRSPVAGQGRSFGEAWVWGEDGKAVACMSQQSILRPAKGKL
ncbi:Thioesterase/thiol ester dehydrase-isomerase [Stemphylium lycopersici]|nr:acyl-CoA thioesterase ii [Stemphylium lycopersici]RAR02495.1 Thioesterase/thiol ester dehydrase-isomerase [Stemphylium lycopersici]